jgi:predicted nucleic acid-binding protein
VKIIEDFYRGCRVMPFSRQILLEASKLRELYSFSVWDSLIVASVKEAEVATLYSEDMHNGLIVCESLKIVILMFKCGFPL